MTSHVSDKYKYKCACDLEPFLNHVHFGGPFRSWQLLFTPMVCFINTFEGHYTPLHAVGECLCHVHMYIAIASYIWLYAHACMHPSPKPCALGKSWIWGKEMHVVHDS